jgi:hypothetical protein
MQADDLILLSVGATVFSLSFFQQFDNLEIQLPLSVFPVITHAACKINKESLFKKNLDKPNVFHRMDERIQGSGGNFMMRSFMICTHHPILCG